MHPNAETGTGGKLAVQHGGSDASGAVLAADAGEMRSAKPVTVVTHRGVRTHNTEPKLRNAFDLSDLIS